jgi:hypothetical protein
MQNKIEKLFHYKDGNLYEPGRLTSATWKGPSKVGESLCPPFVV